MYCLYRLVVKEKNLEQNCMLYIIIIEEPVFDDLMDIYFL